MRILVTGGGGYVGSILVPLLLDAGHSVRVLDRFIYDDRRIIYLAPHRDLDIVTGDVCDPADARAAIAGQDAVVHLAAVVGYPACANDPERAVTTNVEGTRNLAAVAGDRPIVFASTCSVYGRVDSVCDERVPPAPLTLYGTTKLQGESIVLDSGGVVLRFATLFGAAPRLRLDLLVNNFVHQAIRREYLNIYQAEYRRTFLHVRDAARSCLMVLESIEATRAQIFNVADERTGMTKRSLAERIRAYVPFRIDLAEVGTDDDHRDYEVSSGRIRALGFRPEYTLDQGIEELVRVIRAVSA